MALRKFSRSSDFRRFVGLSVSRSCLSSPQFSHLHPFFPNPSFPRPMPYHLEDYDSLAAAAPTSVFVVVIAVFVVVLDIVYMYLCVSQTKT